MCLLGTLNVLLFEKKETLAHVFVQVHAQMRKYPTSCATRNLLMLHYKI